MSQENVRVSERQQTILDLVGTPISSPFRTIGTTEIRTELIKKKKFKFQEETHKQKGGAKK